MMRKQKQTKNKNNNNNINNNNNNNCIVSNSKVFKKDRLACNTKY